MKNWYTDPIQSVIDELSSDSSLGLTSASAEEKLNSVGQNKLREKKKKTFIQRFFAQIKDFMVIVLIIAAVISFVAEIIENKQAPNLTEPLIILGIVILNALLGVIQESKAEAALEALQKMSSPHSKVIRDGYVQVISSTDLVPGDIVLLEAGDFVPADGRIIESASLKCDESALTGESVPVEKDANAVIDVTAPLGDRVNMVYSGCSVSYGRATFIVTDTGMTTEIGRIAAMLANEEEGDTPLQKQLAVLGKTLAIVALSICLVIFIFSAAMKNGMMEAFMTSVSLAVAAIPEGLPAIVTIVLALGVQRMVKRRAIIQKLPAVETLGSTSVICSDKTGTLTLNRMTLIQSWSYDDDALATIDEGNLTDPGVKLIQLASLCCDGQVEQNDDGTLTHIGDPTETAIVAALLKLGQTKTELEAAYKRVSEIPFDSDRKLMTTVHTHDDKIISITKGAPDILLSKCIGVDLDKVMRIYEQMGENALRVLAIACKPLDSVPENPSCDELESGLTFIGLVGMIDPPREEAKNAIKICQRAGIRTVMITGDHIITARAIAKQLNILQDGDEAITGAQLAELSDKDLLDNIRKYSVYARVTPNDKIRIVKAWQTAGEIVAMTGDGVNDAPALKAADIGCAMGITGTDVAKGAADVTLTDDNFATIVEAVKEGRGIFDNIRKSVQFLLSCNLGEIITVFVCMLIYKVSPLAAMHLLIVNLVTDSLPALALGVEPVEKDIMQRTPRRKDEPLLKTSIAVQTLLQGIMIGALTTIAYVLGRSFSEDVHVAQTMAFGVLALSQLMHVLNIRNSHSIFTSSLLTNRYMILAEIASIGIAVTLMLVPGLNTALEMTNLTGFQWLIVAGLSIVPIIISEIVKLVKLLISKASK